MRKLFLFLFVSFITLFPFFARTGSANAQSVTYALIEKNATLFRLSDDVYLPVCSLPASYFVVVTGEEEKGYTPVIYDDLNGFILSSSITIVDYEPVTKFHNATLSLTNDGHLANIRLLPDHTQDNIVISLSHGSVLHYYGSVNGKTQVDELGDLWYYVRVKNGEKWLYGYVYSLYADATEIPENVIEKVVEPSIGDTSSNDSTDNNYSPTLSPLREGVIITSLCFPVILVAYLLFKKPKRNS